MSNNSYESLNNDRDESSGDDGSFTVRRKEKSSLRIRLNRVFSTGGLRSPKSPGACPSLSNSRGSSPGSCSPSSKPRYSWQPSGFGGKDNRSPDRSPGYGTPKKGSGSPVRSGGITCSPASPATPKSPKNAATRFEARMKYSPQQQQKERKSESDSLNLTSSTDLDSRTKAATTMTVSSNTRQDSSAASENSRFSIGRRGSSTGMFAWMRVFRLASMLHQIGC